MAADTTRIDRLDELSLRQAAHYVNMSVYWLRDRVGRKDGPPDRRRGKVFKFPREEFTAWACQQKVK